VVSADPPRPRCPIAGVAEHREPVQLGVPALPAGSPLGPLELTEHGLERDDPLDLSRRPLAQRRPDDLDRRRPLRGVHPPDREAFARPRRVLPGEPLVRVEREGRLVALAVIETVEPGADGDRDRSRGLISCHGIAASHHLRRLAPPRGDRG
jgi:hypothetical protein